MRLKNSCREEKPDYMGGGFCPLKLSYKFMNLSILTGEILPYGKSFENKHFFSVLLSETSQNCDISSLSSEMFDYVRGILKREDHLASSIE